MARLIVSKLDKFINAVIILFLAGGGVFLHILTALTFKSYYGDPWGYISFALPLFAEIYLIIIQLTDQMYNYTILIISFLLLSTLSTACWFIKNQLMQRLESLLESRS